MSSIGFQSKIVVRKGFQVKTFKRFHFQRPHGDGGELVVLDRNEAVQAEPEAGDR